jgi:UDP-N-acetylglucosamine--N-acetylmuramyl-(pentapeptide) pyrophosphoryl-undecaprenol N-acetylglucosamine transferase
LLYNIKTALYLLTAGIKTGNLIKRFKPDVVIGTGGYICYPVLKKASKYKIPTVIHDSNAIPGLTTKMLSSIVDKVLVSFPNQENLYFKPENVIFTGTPLREEFKNASKAGYERKNKNKPLVVSFWGSLGAEEMNEMIADVIKRNIKKQSFDQIHAVGKKDSGSGIKSLLKQIGVENADELPTGIEIEEYIENMPAVMASADLILCRGGGSTIAELIQLRKPAVIIPSPYVVNNEQEFNAKQLGKIGAAVLMDEKSCTGENVYNTITSLLSDKENLKIMSENIKLISTQNATKNVVEIVLSLIKKGET